MGDVDSAWEAYVSADGLEYYYNTITEETTWDKPECLKGGEDQDSGDWFWIPDESQGYVVGQVLHEYYDGNTTVRTLDGSVSIYFFFVLFFCFFFGENFNCLFYLL